MKRHFITQTFIIDFKVIPFGEISIIFYFIFKNFKIINFYKNDYKTIISEQI